MAIYIIQISLEQSEHLLPARDKSLWMERCQGYPFSRWINSGKNSCAERRRVGGVPGENGWQLDFRSSPRSCPYIRLLHLLPFIYGMCSFLHVSGVGYPTPSVFPPGRTAPLICDFLLSSRSAVFVFLANFFFAVFDNPLALPPPTSAPVPTATPDARSPEIGASGGGGVCCVGRTAGM